MEINVNTNHFYKYLSRKADAKAYITGSEKYPDISGFVSFYKLNKGVLIKAEIKGLPQSTMPCHNDIFAFHIHSGNQCDGNQSDAFANVNGHYNPDNCPHPDHAGDMPPLFGADGIAFLMFLTNNFTVEEVIGRAVIIHASPDDFTTQPSGNAGEKIACGIIKSLNPRI